MRFTPTKKISELEALTSATLDTTFVVGISGSTTYKISINQLTSSLDGAFATDLVTNALSNSLDTKLATTIFNTNSASFHSRINAVSSSVSTGTSGTSGTSGPQGNQGPIGPQGISGTAGSSGVQGPQGNQGVDGSNGTSGTNGSQGTQGPQGEVGPQGISGTAGSSGVQGPQGNQGENGTNGSQGAQGPTGPQGTQGTDGTTFNISQYSGSVGITGSLTVSSIGISDSVFLTNTSSLTLTSGSNLYVQNNGIVQITGSLILSGSTNFTELTGSLASFSSSLNSRIVSGSLTAGSNVNVSDTTPSSPTEGDLWWKSDDGNLYVYYDSYWVVATDTISAIPNGVISGSAQITTLGFVSGSYETTGRGIISGSAQLPSGLISGSSQLPSGLISGSTQLTTSFPSKTTGTWSVPAGAFTQSFTVEANNSYTMWVNGNVPNGIINWNATATISNTNVPVVGAQYGWYYAVGNAIVLTAMPDQFVGTNGSILTSPGSYAPNTSNVFKFGITNNSGTTQTINYGYIKLS